MSSNAARIAELQDEIRLLQLEEQMEPLRLEHEQLLAKQDQRSKNQVTKISKKSRGFFSVLSKPFKSGTKSSASVGTVDSESLSVVHFDDASVASVPHIRGRSPSATSRSPAPRRNRPARRLSTGRLSIRVASKSPLRRRSKSPRRQQSVHSQRKTPRRSNSILSANPRYQGNEAELSEMKSPPRSVGLPEVPPQRAMPPPPPRTKVVRRPEPSGGQHGPMVDRSSIETHSQKAMPPPPPRMKMIRPEPSGGQHGPMVDRSSIETHSQKAMPPPPPRMRPEPSGGQRRPAIDPSSIAKQAAAIGANKSPLPRSQSQKVIRPEPSGGQSRPAMMDTSSIAQQAAAIGANKGLLRTPRPVPGGPKYEYPHDNQGSNRSKTPRRSASMASPRGTPLRGGGTKSLLQELKEKQAAKGLKELCGN